MSALRLQDWWAKHRATLMRLAIALMVIAALIWLGYEFWRLLWQPEPMGAIDLKLRHAEVRDWFAGRPVYDEMDSAVYPPASYVILWPFLGWLNVTLARWLWAATTVASLGWLVYLTVQESGANTPLERAFIALMPLSMYATGATIGNGQLIVHLLPCLVAGLLLLQGGGREWRKDVLAAAMLIVALVKPTVSIPFFWIVLFLPRTLRPASLVLLGYIALTFIAASFQESRPIPLLYDWFKNASEGAAWGAVTGGSVNQHSWLAALGLKRWNHLVSLLALVILGFWTCHNRRRDLWLLLGVAALVARFWTYHGWYDDLLILLPMVALFRIAKRSSSAAGGDVVAGMLLAIAVLAMLAPGGLYLFPPPWNMLYEAGQTIVWIVVLIFLLYQAQREKYSMAKRHRKGRR